MTTTTYTNQPHGLGYLLVRILYFIFIGLWLSSIWAAIAWILSITIIGLPIGLWMLNKLPQVTTLQPERSNLVISSTGEVYRSDLDQAPFIVRALYFVLVGWWFSGLWLALAWALSSSIIGLPFAFWMINRVPAVMTLTRT